MAYFGEIFQQNRPTKFKCSEFEAKWYVSFKILPNVRRFLAPPVAMRPRRGHQHATALCTGRVARRATFYWWS